MGTLLHIQASPMKERSFSLHTATAFIGSYLQSHPSDTVRTVDVFDGTLAEFGVLQAAAKYKILHGKPASEEERTAWAAVERTVAEFRAADKYVLSSAMWNFGPPFMLKKYIDIIVQPTLTFAYSPAEGYKGLVTGKPALLILARGGAYGPGSGAEGYDFQKPYLEMILRFIGFTRIDTILVEPTLMGGPPAAAEKLAAAIAVAREKAKTF